MRGLIAGLILMLGGEALADAPAPSPPPDAGSERVLDVDRKTLSAEEVERYVAPYFPAVRTCFLTHAKAARKATGELRIELVIHRDGSVFQSTVGTPGVVGAARKRLEACVRKQVTAWRFPVRKRFTTALVPYHFHKTTAPGAGPMESCWSPRGCPSKRGRR